MTLDGTRIQLRHATAIARAADASFRHRLLIGTRIRDAVRGFSGAVPPVTDRKPRLLILADQPGWAFDDLALQRKRYMAPSWDVDIQYMKEGPRIDPKAYDLMFNPNWSYSEYDAMFHGKYIRGFFSQKWLRGRLPFRTLMNSLRGAVACVVPDLESFRIIRRSYAACLHVKEGIDINVFFWNRDRSGNDLVVGWTGSGRNKNKRLDSVIRPACDFANVELRVAETLAREDLNEFYNDVDLVLIGSEPLQEGNPLSLFEAGACGRPVLATAVGCVPEIVEDGVSGLVVESSFDSEAVVRAFVSRLNWCKENLSEVRAMGRRHRERVLSERTPEKTCETFRQAVEWAYARRTA